MIELAGLEKSYDGRPVLGPLSCVIRPGEITGLLGANGAGKTTTMRLMAGTLIPSAGRVVLGGETLPEENRRARALIGYLPEGFAQPPELTCFALLAFIARARGIHPLRQAVEQAAAQAGLAHRLQDKAGTLSKGYRCRLGLAAVILPNPPILLLDEPADGLDPFQRRHVYQLIRQWRDAGKTIVLSTHNLEEAEHLCDRFILLGEGKIIGDAPASAVKKGELPAFFDPDFFAPDLPDQTMVERLDS